MNKSVSVAHFTEMRRVDLKHSRSRSYGENVYTSEENFYPGQWSGVKSLTQQQQQQKLMSPVETNLPFLSLYASNGSNEKGKQDAGSDRVDNSEFKVRLLSTLFAGMQMPGPLLMKTLLNDPPLGLFFFNDATHSPPPHTLRRNGPAEMRQRFCQLFSPIRRVASKKRQFRPSTISLPGGIPHLQLTQHRWSMVHLTADGNPTTCLKPREQYTNEQTISSSCSELPVERTMPVIEPGYRDPMGSPETQSTGELKLRMETNVSRLKRDILQLKNAIRHLEGERTNLYDWFIEQMTAARETQDFSHGPIISSEKTIKQSYLKRNNEIKRNLANLQMRLSDTQFVVSHLEVYGLPHDEDIKTYIQTLLKEHRKSGAEATMAMSTPSKASTKPEPSKDVLLSAPKADRCQPLDKNDADPKYASSSSGDICISRRSPSGSLSEAALGFVDPHLVTHGKSHTLPTSTTSITVSDSPVVVAKPSARTLPLDVTNSARVTRVKPVSSSGLLGRPDSPSLLSQGGVVGESLHVSTTSESLLPPKARFYLEPTPQPPTLEKQSVSSTTLPLAGPLCSSASTADASSKKPRTSIRGVFKHGFRFFDKPFRKSEVSVHLQRSASEEKLPKHITGSSMLSPEHAPHLCKSPSAASTRILGLSSKQPSSGVSTTSKHKKTGGQGNIFPDYQDPNLSHKKKSHPASLSSGTGHHGRHGSVCEPNINGGGESATDSDSHMNNVFTSILEVLSGDRGTFTSPISCHLPPVTSSGSSQSGGQMNGFHSSGVYLSNLPGSISAMPSGGPSYSVATSPPPAYNVAMALMMMQSHFQSRIDVQETFQQKMLADLKEEIGAARQDIVGCRDKVSIVAVEVEALNRDMQTKGEVQNQNLSDAISRLEQLDARVEEWRQTVRQDFVALQKKQKSSIDPLEYQLATKTRDLQDSITTLNNKVNIMEKSMEQLSNVGRDQPCARRLLMHTLTDLGVSSFAFITALIQILIKFLNAGATVTQNRAAVIALNISLLCFLLFIFFSEPLLRWWHHKP